MIRVLNSKRPAANRKSLTEMAERLLECIFEASKHFSESAVTEYNLPAGQRSFEYVAPNPNAPHRNFGAIEDHYHQLWKAAVDSKMPGFHVREPAKRPAAAVRHTLESGLVMQQLGGSPGREAPEWELANMGEATS